MGGAAFVCGLFEGNDKSASPIVSVMDEAFVQAFLKGSPPLEKGG